MQVVIVILGIVIAVAIGGFAIYAVRSSGQIAEVQTGQPRTRERRPLPPVESFHVRGDTASVVFSVPLGDDQAGQHLTHLLEASAVEFVRDKVDAGLPLEDVHKIAVSAMRGPNSELLATVDLPSAGELPEPAPIVAHDPDSHDPIAAVQAVVSDETVSTPERRSDTPEPVARLVELSAPTEAHLRATGVDPDTMSLTDLAVGFLSASGYTVTPSRSGFSMPSLGPDSVFSFTRGADSGVLAIVAHTPGEYPELDESVIAQFSVAVSQANPRRAILITDKFGPYGIYERERRDPRLVFVTRERLQSFVDSFDLT